jgi:hypothetical protein
VSAPTPLSPWFVVLRLREDDVAEEYVPEWYSETDPDEDCFAADRTKARLFDSIHTAARVARATGGYAVVVVDEESLKEYRPRGL